MKLLRVAADLELTDVAAETGLSLSLVEKIENGRRRPTHRAAARIENLFGQRIFSSPREHRARLKRQPPSIIEFIEPDALANPVSPNEVVNLPEITA